MGLSSRSHKFDIAIVGGGPSGAAAALSLAREGSSVALLERSYYENARIGETVPPEICELLKELNVWRLFQHQNHLPLTGITSCWGSKEQANNDFIFNPYGHGWVLDRSRFDRMLAEAARDAGAKLFCGYYVTECVPSEGFWRIRARHGSKEVSMRANFLVNATGQTGRVTGISSPRLNDGRLIAAIKYGLIDFRRRSSTARLLVESAEEGWWYSVPTPSGGIIFAHLTDVDLMCGDRRARERLWRERLDKTVFTKSRAQSVMWGSTLRVCFAANTCASEVAAKGWISIGDSARSQDPLSGHGIYNALRMGLDASNLLLKRNKTRGKAMAKYSSHVAKAFAESLSTSTAYYGRELAWRSAPFWSRRQGQ